MVIGDPAHGFQTSAIASAVAEPIPDLPPVISAVLP
jgi:hypothetical protein